MRKQDKRNRKDLEAERSICGVEVIGRGMTFEQIGAMISAVLVFLQEEKLPVKALTVTPGALRVVFYCFDLEAKAKAEPYIISRFPEKNRLSAFASWYVHRGLHLWIESGYNKPLEAKQ